MILFSWGTSAQIINFPDANFKAKIISLGIDTNNDGEIQLDEASQVISLDISNATISDLTGINFFFGLTFLNCSANIMSTLDISGLLYLTELDCGSNQLLSLQLNNLTNLQYLDFSYNQISSIDLSSFNNLVSLKCNNNQLSSLTISSLMNNLEVLYCYNNALTSIDVNGLGNLLELSCGSNQLTSLNLIGLSSLTSLSCEQNQLTVLDLSGLLQLTGISCSNNQISSLDVSSLSNLIDLFCSFNQLTSLDVSNLQHLQSLECRNNQLTTLNTTATISLSRLFCENNQIVTLNLGESTNLENLLCSYNLLTSLDVSHATSLLYLFCDNNNLNTLNIKNGTNEDFSIAGNQNLEYVCADEGFETEIIQILINSFPNCHVNSYCSFNPGGTFYRIQGNSRYDSNANGCDAGDVVFPNLKFTFSDGTNIGNLIADQTGYYHYDVQAGTQTITPILEDPTYFNISSAAPVSFPTASSPLTQDFCILANGVHNDLEVSILPIIAARPGFDTTYRIIYKNKGTQTQTGTIVYIFNDALLDLVNANPIVASQGINSLNWNFTNLVPFETREIILSFNVNSPIEVPPVIGGDILNFTAHIFSLLTEETPTDNTFNLNQTVFNSLDPNDKTCLEGNTITPEMVGKEVHYMIRFENTGTANAENVVVKDIIDSTKFDVNSLIPVAGSRPFVTRYSATNTIEFIFENINLPFDDANNDGYVAFKIKTKPSLVLGDTFSNTASIYFDYNFPIITNTANTAVALLANSDFAFESYFKIYPNPAKDVLNIDTKKSIEVTSISIYNTLGQLVIVIPNAQQTKSVDVSSLKPGNNFIKINSDKGSSTAKFVKL